MVLQALARYYDILSTDSENEIAPPNYSMANVSFALNLSLEGKVKDIFPLFEHVARGNKFIDQPRRLLVPEQVKRSSGISSNFLCDNCAYVLGISEGKKKDPDYAIKRFKAFKEFNLKLLSKINCAESQALKGYFKTHDPQKFLKDPVVSSSLSEILKGGNLVFMLDGGPGFIHEAPEIKQGWDAFQNRAVDVVYGQCLVNGNIGPIARLHYSLKGIKGANPTGATLVGFNAHAYESYNRVNGQGLNSPVSETAAFAYTTALNYLNSSRGANQKFTIGDTTVTYWAESPERGYAAVFAGLFGLEPEREPANSNEDIPLRDTKAEQRMRDVAEKIRGSQAIDLDYLMEGLNPSTQFFVLGLSPNAARVSVRFFYTDLFSKMLEKIMLHYRDLQIEKEFSDQPTYLPIYTLLRETISTKASDPKPSPLMSGALFRSILNGGPYPAALYYTIINRIHADVDDPKSRTMKVDYARAAIIKAYLTRKYRNRSDSPFQEVLSMSLNPQSTNQAYLLGRLFAVLEKVQQDAAAPAKLNATIKDRYFTSACASPATVFPILLRLSQHHISKAEYGKVSDKRIEEIMGLLDVDRNPFPARLTLDEQGIFVLGYYHQRPIFFKANKDNSDTTDLTSSEIESKREEK